MKKRKISFICPFCGNEWSEERDTLIDGEKELTLKRCIEEESYFNECCPSCKKSFTSFFPLLYCDLKRKFLIALVLEDTSWLDDVNALPQFQSFTKRIVYNEKELKEKITVFENELDDEGIAKVKNQIKGTHVVIYFEKTNDELLWFMSETGPIGVEKRFYRPIGHKYPYFVYIEGEV